MSILNLKYYFYNVIIRNKEIFITDDRERGGNKSVNLINKKVLHRTLGEGKVISCNDDYIKIDFESGEKKFIFPDVFGKYMTLKDQKVFDLVKKRLEENEKEKAGSPDRASIGGFGKALVPG